MTSRPPSSSSNIAVAASRAPHPTPHHTGPRSRSISSTRVPPHAPKPNRRPTDLSTSSTSSSAQINPVFNLGLVPRASCGKADDILAPPDAQSCPFAKAGLKIFGIGTGAYGELEGYLEWPAELYANERRMKRFVSVLIVEKQAQMAKELSAINPKDDRIPPKGTTDPRVVINP